MYRAFFGIENKPFSIVPDARFFYMSEKHREALAHLVYGVKESGGFVLLTGDVGTGKTLISRCLVDDLGNDIEVALILNPLLTDLELLANICDELGIAYDRPATSRKDLVDRINGHLLEAYAKGRRVLLIIDEAQDLTPEVLEQVRLLTNLETSSTKLLQIVLIGQPELLDILNRTEMRQVAQRITARFHLTPLTEAETAGYINHRLTVAGMWPGVFRQGAIREIHGAAGGVPRLVNVICDRCLLGAYAKEQKTVDRRIARGAAAEILGAAAPRRSGGVRVLPWAAGAAAAAVIALLVAGPMDGMASNGAGAAWLDRAAEPFRHALALIGRGETAKAVRSGDAAVSDAGAER